MKTQLRLDIAKIRENAREKMSEGAVTPAYHGDAKAVVEVLNEALATELVCNLRYRNHYFMATGLVSQAVADEFLEHAKQEHEHADWIAQRIVQLGGVPNFNPAGLAERSHAEYREGERLRDMIREDLVAERIAVQTYSEIVRWLGESDPTTRRLVERILEVEEEHADDLANLSKQMEG